MSDSKVVLITGAARRVGAEIARWLHVRGMNVIIHYQTSKKEAEALVQTLNNNRKNSAAMLMADLNEIAQCEQLIENAQKIWQRLDVLVNNASRFYPSPLGKITNEQWQDLMGSNLQAPFFLAQAAAQYLRPQRGCIINIADIHADKPLKNYSVYCIAKAGLVMLTKTLAKEFAPDIRVNAIAPGAILWPEVENELTAERKNKIVNATLLKRAGMPQDIAKVVNFLINDGTYMTGQILTVDGGRSLNI